MKTVKIRRRGRLISICPFPDFLRRVLTFTISRSEWQDGDLESVPQLYEFYEQSPENSEEYLSEAGFTYRISNELQENGYQVDYADFRNLEIESPDFSKLTIRPRTWQKDAFAAVLSSDGGLINVATAAGKTVLIEQLTRIHPNTRVVITSQESPPLSSLYESLKSDFPHKVAGLGVVGRESNPRQITLCHTASLHKTDMDHTQLLFYDEVHGAGAEKTSEILREFSLANAYGFSASIEGRFDQAEPLIEGLFGPVLFTYDHKDAVRAGDVSSLDVHLYTVSGPSIMHERIADRIREGIVRNRKRNSTIGRILRENYADKSVVVIARDNLEHVFRLRQYLPNYTCVYDKIGPARWHQLKNKGLIPADEKPLSSGEHLKIAQKFRRGEVQKVIATSVWDTGIDLPRLQVLWRAEGSPGMIPAIQLPGRVVRPKEEGAILGDTWDDFGPIFQNMSDARIKRYKQIGYQIIKRKKPWT